MKKNENKLFVENPSSSNNPFFHFLCSFNESLPLLVLVLQPNLNKLFSSTTSSFFGVRSRFGVVWFGLVVRFVAFVSSEAREPLFVLVLFLCPSLDPPWHLGKAGTACAHSAFHSKLRLPANRVNWQILRWFCAPCSLARPWSFLLASGSNRSVKCWRKVSDS